MLTDVLAPLPTRAAGAVPVLLVDDDDRAAAFVRAALESDGPSVSNLDHIRRLADVAPVLDYQDTAVVLLEAGFATRCGATVIGEHRARWQAPVVLLADGASDVTELAALASEIVTRADGADVLRRAVHHAAERARLECELRRATQTVRERDDQLRQATKMEAIGHLAGGIAHDFGNLLTVIAGACERLQDEIASARPVSIAELAAIQNSARRATALTRQLMSFSRQQTVAMQPLDLAQLIGRTARLLKRLIGEHIALTLDIAAGVSLVEADPVQIEQVLMNLAINARDAMPNGGTLRLALGHLDVDDRFVAEHQALAPGQYVLVEVQDTGCGMSADTVVHAFEPFFTTKGQGTGLGLSTVSGIVKRCGGYIWLTSGVGTGTTFHILLPPSAALAVACEPPPAMHTRRAAAGTVLLTEDDDDVRVMLREFLCSAGHAVIEARHPDDAVAQADRFDGRIDLLLTDVVMPGGGGRELGRRIADRRPGLKVLYMSGYPDGGGPLGEAADPAAPFLAKPFTRAVLLSAVDRLLA